MDKPEDSNYINQNSSYLNQNFNIFNQKIIFDNDPFSIRIPINPTKHFSRYKFVKFRDRLYSLYGFFFIFFDLSIVILH